MVKLERGAAPAQLDAAFVIAQTAEFKANRTSVWNVQWLKDALSALSSEKCAYCECPISTTATYMEVEHYVSKKQDEDKVLEWENLLPSCKRCNGNKLAHDVIAEPIINPFKVDPVKELFLRLYLIKGKTVLGKTTEEVLGLNETSRLVEVRFKVGQALLDTLNEVIEKMERFQENPITRRRTALTGSTREVLALCQPEAQFAATCATVLHTSAEYGALKAFLQGNALWDADMDMKDQESKKIAFELR